MNMLITGGAGYIGSFFIKEILKCDKISKIFVIDLKRQPKDILPNKKIFWIQYDLAENRWQGLLKKEGVDIVIHSAFRIRSAFGKIKKNEKENFELCKNVFNFCFDNNIPKLIYLSSVAGYGARKENIGKILKEKDALMEKKSPYGSQKRKVEIILSNLIGEKKPFTNTFVLRLASVTGPYGQSLKQKFGLITVLKKALPFVIEINKNWGRQWVHERDVVNILCALSLEENVNGPKLAIFNIAPEDFLTAKDIGKLLNKKIIKAPLFLMKMLLFFLWPVSFGKLIPPAAINGLVYPIKVDGSKIKNIGLNYRYSSKDSLLAKK